MKISSWKKSTTVALLNALITFAVLTVFVCFIYYVFLNGEEFIGKDKTVYIINGISFYSLILIGVILSAFVPIIFLKFEAAKYLITYCICSSIIYVILYIFFLSFGEIISFGFLYPLENFDTMIYAVFSFPLGSAIGTVISIAIHFIKKKCI
ncbi:MAG: hypothetical protein MRZ66_08675 [Clostridiales bacterium]|nr:hypothetical protein [Clostridiales bacterium]